MSKLDFTDLPEEWRNEFGRYRFTYFAGLRELFITAGLLHQMNKLTVASILEDNQGSNPKSYHKLHELLSKNDLDDYPGKAILESGYKDKRLSNFGHLSFGQADLEALVKTKPMNYAKAKMILAALSTVEVWPHYVRNQGKPSFDIRLAIYQFQEPGTLFEDILSERERLLNLKRQTGMRMEEFWIDLAAGFPITLKTAKKIREKLGKQYEGLVITAYTDRYELTDRVKSSKVYKEKIAPLAISANIKRPSRKELIFL